MTNTLSRLPTAAFAGVYGAADHAPANRSADGRMIERAETLRQQQAVIDKLTEKGVLQGD
jgi:hypothetical protein